MEAETVDQLLHDADRAVGGANMARQMSHSVCAAAMDREAVDFYRRALRQDPMMVDPAWRETANRDVGWLRRRGLTRIAELGGE